MLTSGKKGLRERRSIFKTVNYLPVYSRNRLRICRLDGVNGHQGHSRGGKVILSDQMVKQTIATNILIFKR